MTLKIKKNKTKKDKFLEKHNLPKPKEEKEHLNSCIAIKQVNLMYFTKTR